jgi:endo-1,4-beta-xylanase
MHLLLPFFTQTPPTKGGVLETMRRFGELGVDLYITELDLNLHGRPGSKQERWDFQARVYGDMMAACLESGVCKSFATWGISDATSWLICTEGWWCQNLSEADPLMFDGEYQPKPAYQAVRDALSQP